MSQVMSGNLISLMGNESTGFENAHYELSTPLYFFFNFPFSFFISYSLFFHAVRRDRMGSTCIYIDRRRG